MKEDVKRLQPAGLLSARVLRGYMMKRQAE